MHLHVNAKHPLPATPLKQEELVSNRTQKLPHWTLAQQSFLQRERERGKSWVSLIWSEIEVTFSSITWLMQRQYSFPPTVMTMALPKSSNQICISLPATRALFQDEAGPAQPCWPQQRARGVLPLLFGFHADQLTHTPDVFGPPPGARAVSVCTCTIAKQFRRKSLSFPAFHSSGLWTHYLKMLSPKRSLFLNGELHAVLKWDGGAFWLYLFPILVSLLSIENTRLCLQLPLFPDTKSLVCWVKSKF